MAYDMETETLRQKLAEKLWRREGGHCVSMLVSALCDGTAGTARRRSELASLCEQAYELALPVADYEEPVREHIHDLERADIVEALDDRQVEYDGADVTKTLAEKLFDDINDSGDLKDFARKNRIEPYGRDVFEHWIVSDWLADKLIAAGEKCDKDFAGLTVWARCTTGQAIWLDGVIQGIALAIWPTAEDQKRVLAA